MASPARREDLLPVGVYRLIDPINGHVAYCSVDWSGHQSDPRIVGDDELETDVIAELGEAVSLDQARAPLTLLTPSRLGKPSVAMLIGRALRR